MNVSASTYYKSHDVQRLDDKALIEEYSNKIKWRPEGEDTLLDIGCGCGDVTVDFIAAAMPKNFKLLLGVDIANDMIELARNLYDNPKIHFEKLDIEGSIESILQKYPAGFDHATSFYALHWIRNLNLATSNIYDLLKPGGDCLLMILASHTFFDTYKKLSIREDKWSNYAVDPIMLLYQYHERPSEDFISILNSVKFRDCDVKEIDKSYTFQGVGGFKRNLFAVHPFIERLTPDEQIEYFKDFLKILMDEGLVKQNDESNDLDITVCYKLIVAYAVK